MTRADIGRIFGRARPFVMSAAVVYLIATRDLAPWHWGFAAVCLALGLLLGWFVKPDRSRRESMWFGGLFGLFVPIVTRRFYGFGITNQASFHVTLVASLLIVAGTLTMNKLRVLMEEGRT